MQVKDLSELIAAAIVTDAPVQGSAAGPAEPGS
jgi:hypothetical protein